MNNNWVTFSWSHDERFDRLKELITTSGDRVSHRHMTGPIRGFLSDSGIKTDEPIAFLNGSYIGTYEDVINFFKV